MIDFRDLVKHGVHFGHQTSKWNPKMAPYIWGHKNGIHLIDVSRSAQAIEKAAQFLESIAAEGKSILWVGTKKPAQKAVQAAGEKLGMPSVTYRWIGGTLTNFPQVKKSVTKLLHFEDILSKSDDFSYTKKELNQFDKMVERLSRSVGGIRKLTWPVGAVVLVDVKKEETALREAAIAGVPVVSFVDTNSDPSMVDYVIPSNDDSPKAIQFVLDYLVSSVEKGQKKAAANKKAEAENKAAPEKVEAKAEDKPAAKKAAPKKAAPKKTEAKAEDKPAAKKAAPKKAAPKKAEAKAEDKPAAKKAAPKKAAAKKEEASEGK